MAKLYFKYGAMGSSKTAQALITKYNYEENDLSVWLLKPSADTRDGQTVLRSRIGLAAEVETVPPERDLEALFREQRLGKCNVIIVDECQFLTPAQIDQLRSIVDEYNIPVMCFGLRTDFQTKLFPGSLRLMEVADTIQEIKTICDCGANAECTPEFLLQFGLVGSAYARKQLGIQQPRVGLLNIGTEDSKGTQLQKDAYGLLKDADAKGLLHFVGNVEARDVPLGEVDVVVCDGFSGNVLLKSIEGTAMFMGSLMKKMFKKNLGSKLGYVLCASGVKDMMKLMDYREIGGTQFLGIKKPVIKAHGASDALAFRNAVKQAAQAAQNDMTPELEQALRLLAEAKEQTND